MNNNNDVIIHEDDDWNPRWNRSIADAHEMTEEEIQRHSKYFPEDFSTCCDYVESPITDYYEWLGHFYENNPKYNSRPGYQKYLSEIKATSVTNTRNTNRLIPSGLSILDNCARP